MNRNWLMNCAFLLAVGGASSNVSADTAYQWNLVNENSPEPCTSPDFNCANGWDTSRTVLAGTSAPYTQPDVDITGLYQVGPTRTGTQLQYNGQRTWGAWDNTGGNLQQGLVNAWSGGLGVTAEANSPWTNSPLHAVSNSSGVEYGAFHEIYGPQNDYYDITETYHWESVLFDFGAGNLIALDKITVGWESTDSDLAILAKTGGNLNASGIDLNVDDYASLIASGEWEIVDRLADVYDQTNRTAMFNTDHSINARFWMAAMVNEQFSGTGGNWIGYNDRAKISMIGGLKKSPVGAPGVPEPTGLLLMSAGLGLIGYRNRRKK